MSYLDKNAPTTMKRREALARGLTRYFIGKPCPQGHIAERRARNGECIECRAVRLKAWHKANPEENRARVLQWQKDNKHLANAKGAKRWADKIKATPLWADNKRIRFIYKKGSEFGMDVDHIVPLRSEIVCGLHCEDNLQLLVEYENAVKSNKYWPDMPEAK